MSIIECRNLSIGFENKKKKSVVAECLNIDFQKGKLVGIIGQNGVGKSTFLRTISGIQKSLSGSVFIDKKNIKDYRNIELAQKIGLVLTEKLPESNLTIYELVALGRQPYTNWTGRLTENDYQKIETALTISEIGHLKHKKHYEVSDGQLQIALIARVLSQETDVIILDEPTTHLDILHKIRVLKLLKNLATQSDICIIFSTHDIELAIQICDEMVLFTDKNCIKDTPKNLMTQNIFQSVFKSKEVVFDEEKGGFVIS